MRPQMPALLKALLLAVVLLFTLSGCMRIISELEPTPPPAEHNWPSVLNNPGNRQALPVTFDESVDARLRTYQPMTKADLEKAISPQVDWLEASFISYFYAMRHWQAGEYQQGLALLNLAADHYYNPLAMVKLAELYYYGSEQLLPNVGLGIEPDAKRAFGYLVIAFEITDHIDRTERALGLIPPDKRATDLLNFVANDGLALLNTLTLEQGMNPDDPNDLDERFTSRLAGFETIYLNQAAPLIAALPSRTVLPTPSPTLQPSPTLTPGPTPSPAPLLSEPRATPLAAPTLVATEQLVITNTSSYINSIGAFYVLGEVENQSEIVVGKVRINMEILDAEGQVLGVDFGFTDLNSITPGQRMPFKVLVPDFETTPAFTTATSYNLMLDPNDFVWRVASLQIITSTISIDSRGEATVTGKVENTGQQTARFVGISGAFYNAAGAVIGVNNTFTIEDTLAPGEIGNFELRLFSYAKQLGPIESYNLVVEGMPVE